MDEEVAAATSAVTAHINHRHGPGRLI